MRHFETFSNTVNVLLWDFQTPNCHWELFLRYLVVDTHLSWCFSLASDLTLSLRPEAKPAQSFYFSSSLIFDVGNFLESRDYL